MKQNIYIKITACFLAIIISSVCVMTPVYAEKSSSSISKNIAAENIANNETSNINEQSDTSNPSSEDIQASQTEENITNESGSEYSTSLDTSENNPTDEAYDSQPDISPRWGTTYHENIQCAYVIGEL